MGKLIIIRGNSGSGKTLLAKKLRESARKPNRVALIEQDYLRRHILKEKESEGTNNIALIRQTVLFAFEHGYDVILEGILYSKRYRTMIKEISEHADNTYIFYIDVSFDETLVRHKKKENAHEFGEKEMKKWYKKLDVLKKDYDIILPESNTIENSLDSILQLTGI